MFYFCEQKLFKGRFQFIQILLAQINRLHLFSPSLRNIMRKGGDYLFMPSTSSQNNHGANPDMNNDVKIRAGLFYVCVVYFLWDCTMPLLLDSCAICDLGIRFLLVNEVFCYNNSLTFESYGRKTRFPRVPVCSCGVIIP